MLMYQCDEHGCVYSIDSEGVLYVTPQFQDDTIDLTDWTEVDHMAMLGEEQSVRDVIDTVHEKLIAASKAMGEYFQRT